MASDDKGAGWDVEKEAKLLCGCVTCCHPESVPGVCEVQMKHKRTLTRAYEAGQESVRREAVEDIRQRVIVGFHPSGSLTEEQIRELASNPSQHGAQEVVRVRAIIAAL